MTRRTLNIWLLSPGGEGDPTARKALVQTFQPLVSPVLPVADPIRFAIDLDDPALPRLAKVLQDAIGKRRLATLAILRLDEEFVEDPAQPAEWYALQFETELIDMGATPLGFPTMKADRVVSNTHTAGFGYVSENFKAFVEHRGLRGLDFIWLPDMGRYRARQWYFPLADRMLGRGLDHDWFDPARITDNWWMTSQPGWRTGVVKFKADQMKPGVSLGRADADALLSLAENAGRAKCSATAGTCENSFRRMLISRSSGPGTTRSRPRLRVPTG